MRFDFVFKCTVYNDTYLLTSVFCNVRYFNGGPPEEVDYGCVVSYVFVLYSLTIHII